MHVKYVCSKPKGEEGGRRCWVTVQCKPKKTQKRGAPKNTKPQRSKEVIQRRNCRDPEQLTLEQIQLLHASQLRIP